MVVVLLCQGHSYLSTDELCPMREIYMLANADNMWANVQTFKEPWKLQWDLTKPKFWAPLFRPDGAIAKCTDSLSSLVTKPPCTSLQASELDYSPPDLEFAKQVRSCSTGWWQQHLHRRVSRAVCSAAV